MSLVLQRDNPNIRGRLINPLPLSVDRMKNKVAHSRVAMRYTRRGSSPDGSGGETEGRTKRHTRSQSGGESDISQARAAGVF